ncbi:MAG: formate dehydrogenase [Alphaproteobacteria bacterium]|nr:formate dehydrogenase [Alphaproteobacteria bacterium]
MCACRCGIKVHLRDGKVRYIEGNRDHPVNHGVLCAKGSAGIMTQTSPARLTKPLKRVGPRGAGEFQEIEWSEALATAEQWLGRIRATDPKKLAFFTGRDQSQALTAWWAAEFGTPNYAAHGGFCSVNMAAAGMYSIGGSFWEFGEPDFERTRYFMLFGVAEDHASNPLKIGINKLRQRGAKFVSVNPIRTGYSAVADDWVGIRPGTDGLFIFSLIHELLSADKIDFAYLVRYTNASWLVIDAPGSAAHGLFVRSADGRALVWDGENQRLASSNDITVKPALVGRFALPNGTSAIPSFELLARRFLAPEYAPERVAATTGVEASKIRQIAAELARVAFEEEIVLDLPWTDWAGRRHDKTVGRPVSFHAMRGISAHANGFHTCRALHVLQMLLGSIDVPGGWRYKPPYPRQAPPGPKPSGKSVAAGKTLGGSPLGYPLAPEDLLVDSAGRALRIDKAFSWEAPLAAHGLMHLVITNAWKGDPYPIDTLFMFMANMSWNSAMNTTGTRSMLTDKDDRTGEYKIPRIIYSDAFWSEMAAYADLILPDTTYLERYDCISMLDRPIGTADAAADSIRQPVIALDRDVRPFQDVLIELGARLKLPGLIDANGAPRYPGGYADYITRHERAPGVGLLAGWRGSHGDKAGRGAANPRQLDAYIANKCFWTAEIPDEAKFYRFANMRYLAHAEAMGFLSEPKPITLQLYVEPLQRFRLAAEGHGTVQPPPAERERIRTYFDPLPIWYPPFEEAAVDAEQFPLHAVTQRPMAMYHSWGSHNAWQRQIHSENRLYMHRATGTALGIADDDWVWIVSHHARVKGQVRLMDGVNRHTVWTWNAIGRSPGAVRLAPNAPEVTRGFLLNHIISELLPARDGGYRYANADPVTGQAAWYDLRVRIERIGAFSVVTDTNERPLQSPPNARPVPLTLSYGREFRTRS